MYFPFDRMLLYRLKKRGSCGIMRFNGGLGVRDFCSHICLNVNASQSETIIGSPIYLGDITSQVYGLIERLHFCTLSYDNYSNYFIGKVNVGTILTMNAPKTSITLLTGRRQKKWPGALSR